MYPSTEYWIAAVLKAYGCTEEKSREQGLFLYSPLLVSEASARFMNCYMNVSFCTYTLSLKISLTSVS